VVEIMPISDGANRGRLGYAGFRQSDGADHQIIDLPCRCTSQHGVTKRGIKERDGG